MTSQKYKIEVTEHCVLLQGYLTIAEAFDFLSYYEKYGFDCVYAGDDNGCLIITKKNQSLSPMSETHSQELVEENKRLKDKVTELSNLIAAIVLNHKTDLGNGVSKAD